MDLYRIGVYDLYQKLLPWPLPASFKRDLQDMLFHQAKECAKILSEALGHGTATLADISIPYYAFESTRTMLYHVTRIVGSHVLSGQLSPSDALQLIGSNMEVLYQTQDALAISSTLFPAALSMLEKLGKETNLQILLDLHQEYRSKRSKTSSLNGTAPKSSTGPPPMASPMTSANEGQSSTVYRVTGLKTALSHILDNEGSGDEKGRRLDAYKWPSARDLFPDAPFIPV